MRLSRVFTLLFFAGSTLCVHAEVALSEKQIAFRRELANEVGTLQKRNAGAAVGVDGWLFLTSELRFLAQGVFWGDAAAKTSRARRSDAADPLPAIVDFHRQLQERGIELLIVPVPAKAAIYPEKIGIASAPGPLDSAPFLQEFYGELKQRGIKYLDLTPVFAAHREDNRGPLYCRTDTHWSGLGCVLAATAIAQEVRSMLPSPPPPKEFTTDWKEINITGDLAALIPGAGKAVPEKISIRQISGAVQKDGNSPVLILGDSHTLVFHDFLAERAGLLDQLAAELHFVPDLIGTRGSGATPVRISLYRRSRSEPDFLAKKKVIVWCFAARELTEADEGWVVQPVASK